VIRNVKIITIVTLFLFLLLSCTKEKKEYSGQELYGMYCASCHIAPDINHLPKKLWTEKILPEMAARLGIKDGQFKPYDKMGFDEIQIIHKSGVYPYKPVLNEVQWGKLKNYVLSMAPDSLPGSVGPKTAKEQTRFRTKAFALDETPGSYFTFLKYDASGNNIWLGDYSGQVNEYSFENKTLHEKHKVDNAVVDYVEKDTVSYITDIGILDPSELSTGKIVAAYDGNRYFTLPDTLHRPVNNLVSDLNGDGRDELVVSEFGNLTGQLSLIYQDEDKSYHKKVLLNQPGTIRTIAKDLTSQGDESITILYQRDNLSFTADKVLRFSPIYGSSWFELLDFDGDGDDDIITVNGDNADKTSIPKPYHGLRIHLNDGNNQFKEAFFYPLNGATRFVVDDFDKDGDYDFTIISTFPDYENRPEYAVIYLENLDKEAFEFQPFTFEKGNASRWFLLDSGDIDHDGDTDVILSAFTYVFTPVPMEITKKWQENNLDLMILENTLVDNNK
jgi:hypothetical protein